MPDNNQHFRRVTETVSLFEEWTPYEGPKGGRGWKWNGQGKPRYQEDKPGRDENPRVGNAIPQANPPASVPQTAAPVRSPAAEKIKSLRAQADQLEAKARKRPGKKRKP